MGRAGQPDQRLYRHPEGRLVAGVAMGLSQHLRIPVIMVRLGFLALALVGGLGALLYAAYWAAVPITPERAAEPRPRDTVQLVAFGCLAIGIQLIALMTGFGGLRDAFGWLLALIAVGAGIIWHQADPELRQQWSAVVPGMPRLAGRFGGQHSFVVRLGVAAVLVLVGSFGMVAVFAPMANAGWSALLNGLLFTLIALGGLMVVLGPLVWGMVGALRAEREAVIRERERAEVAAMVHDEVLHTLALIQRSSSDQRTVSRLARSQERVLRNWLYRSTGSSADRLGAALEAASAEVENEFSITVDTVLVGDCPVDQHVAALVAAAREALVNAAKHAGAPTVSLYAEVEPGQLSVFVRDRGAGFDLSQVDGDRHGVRGSIIGRMARHGGHAEVRTSPGAGCEVRLVLPVRRDA